MTNMGGRLESHLREVKLEELFQELKRKIGEKKAVEKLERLSEATEPKTRAALQKLMWTRFLAATRYAHGQKTLDSAIGGSPGGCGFYRIPPGLGGGDQSLWDTRRQEGVGNLLL